MKFKILNDATMILHQSSIPSVLQLQNDMDNCKYLE